MATIYEQIEELQIQVTALQTQLAGMQAQVLTSGTDIFTLGVGEYIIPSAEICATLLNKPTTRTATGYVSVKAAGTAGQLIMTYAICDKTSVSYFQTSYYTTGWGAWHEIDLTTTAWADLPLATGISAYNEAQKPRYCKVGKTVFITGVLKGITASDIVIATLPEGYRPSKRVICPVAAVGQMITKISIDTNGEVVYNRSTVEPVLAENWHSIACSFKV